MAGNQLLVYMQRVGWKDSDIKTWNETEISLNNGVWTAKTTPLKKTLDLAAGRTFAYELMIKLGEMFLKTLKAGTSPFTDGKVQLPFSSAGIGQRDLVCYICMDEGDSVINRFDSAAFKRAKALAQQLHPVNGLGGMTFPLNHLNGTPGGICSEIYMGTITPDTTVCANTIYHELMHNKTNRAGGEDTNWPHTRGGGGLAKASSAGFEGLGDATAQIMCGHLLNANAQFVDGFFANS
jgi:hypothetical protein